MKHTDELLDWYINQHRKSTEDERIRAAILADRATWPNLQPVITWLENGCDPNEAAKELRSYDEAIHGMKTKRTIEDLRISNAVLAEREACAMTVREMDLHGEEIAAAEAIRARSDK